LFQRKDWATGDRRHGALLCQRRFRDKSCSRWET
jgi:hypothetical protein